MDPNASSGDESNRDDLNPTESSNESKTETAEVSVNDIDVSSSSSDEETSNERLALGYHKKYHQTDKEPFLIGRVGSSALGGVYVFAHETEDVLDKRTLLLLKNKRILGEIGHVKKDGKQLKYWVPTSRTSFTTRPMHDDEVFCIPNDEDVTFYVKDKSRKPAAPTYDTTLFDYFEGYL